jgi:hypothetical protein
VVRVVTASDGRLDTFPGELACAGNVLEPTRDTRRSLPVTHDDQL